MSLIIAPKPQVIQRLQSGKAAAVKDKEAREKARADGTLPADAAGDEVDDDLDEDLDDDEDFDDEDDEDFDDEDENEEDGDDK